MCWYSICQKADSKHNLWIFLTANVLPLAELSVGMTTEGIEVRSVGNTKVNSRNNVYSAEIPEKPNRIVVFDSCLKEEFVGMYEAVHSSRRILVNIELLDIHITIYPYPYMISIHLYKLKTVHAKLNSFKYSFFVRIVQPWNNLSEYIVEVGSLKTFKERLREYLID